MPGDLAGHNCTHTHTHYTNVDLPLREHDTQNQFGVEVHRQEGHHGVAEDGLLTGPGTRYSLRALALLELFPTFLSFSRSSRFVSECSSQDSGSFSLENTVCLFWGLRNLNLQFCLLCWGARLPSACFPGTVASLLLTSPGSCTFFPQAIQATITRILLACWHFPQAILFVCAHACRGSAGKLVEMDTISKADHNSDTGSHSPSRNHPPTQQSNHSKSHSHSKTLTAHQ